MRTLDRIDVVGYGKEQGTMIPMRIERATADRVVLSFQQEAKLSQEQRTKVSFSREDGRPIGRSVAEDGFQIPGETLATIPERVSPAPAEKEKIMAKKTPSAALTAAVAEVEEQEEQTSAPVETVASSNGKGMSAAQKAKEMTPEQKAAWREKMVAARAAKVAERVAAEKKAARAAARAASSEKRTAPVTPAATPRKMTAGKKAAPTVAKAQGPIQAPPKAESNGKRGRPSTLPQPGRGESEFRFSPNVREEIATELRKKAVKLLPGSELLATRISAAVERSGQVIAILSKQDAAALLAVLTRVRSRREGSDGWGFLNRGITRVEGEIKAAFRGIRAASPEAVLTPTPPNPPAKTPAAGKKPMAAKRPVGRPKATAGR